MQYSLFKNHFFLSLFICLIQSDSIQTKKSPPSERSSFFLFQNRFGLFSLECIEQAIYFHPKLCLSIIAGCIGYNVYHEELQPCKAWANKHKTPIFCTTMAGLALLYANRKIISQALYNQEEDSTENQETDYQKHCKAQFNVYWPGDISITFDDVAGLQTAKEELQDILTFLQDPEIFHDIGAHVPKGVLLYGPPGNGKTLLARALAGEAQCPFIYINAPSFIEAIIGTGAARIRHLFAAAKKIAPCIIFIDEIDSIGGHRTESNLGSSSNEYAQTLNELLSQLDGFEHTEKPIIVIGATNRVSTLDSALLRPGRFDKKIEITKPYLLDRIQILKLILNKVKHDDTINVTTIAQATCNFSAADLTHLINEAALIAIRKHKTYIDYRDVEEARDIIILGHETHGIAPDCFELYKTAIHEAGHALAYVLQPDALPLYKVSIVARGNSLGVTHGIITKELQSVTPETLRARIIIALAGVTAEELIFKQRSTGCSSDLEYARLNATKMVMEYGMTHAFKDVTFTEFINNQVHLPDTLATELQNEISKIIKECKIESEKLIQTHEKELLKIADLLLDYETISGQIVYEICNMPIPNDVVYSLL